MMIQTIDFTSFHDSNSEFLVEVAKEVLNVHAGREPFVQINRIPTHKPLNSITLNNDRQSPKNITVTT